MATLTDLLTSKVPPHSIEAERAVLGCMLLDPTATVLVVGLLTPEHFYIEAHKRIYTVLLDRAWRDAAIDLLVVAEDLRAQKLLAEVGGVERLASLVEDAVLKQSVPEYCQIIRDRALSRDAIRWATSVIADSYEGRAPIQEVIEAAQSGLTRLQIGPAQDPMIALSEAMPDTLAGIEAACERKELVTGLATGFADLDLVTSGLQPQDFVIIAGRPSMGKTAFALNIARHAGVHQGQRVLVLSLEMSRAQLVLRLLCAEAKVDNQSVRHGQVGAQDWGRLSQAAEQFAGATLWIDDSPGISVLEAKAKARRVQEEHGLDLLVIDYIQLMRGPGDNRQAEVSQISRDLKSLARTLNVPVVALSQLSRAVESRAGDGHRPQLSDLRESGALEQDADVVMFVYRGERYGKGKTAAERAVPPAEIIVAKQRNGPIDVVRLTFVKEYASFEPYVEDPF